MQYFVQGSDGKEYGPVDFATLRTWVDDDRVFPETIVRDALAGQTLKARQVDGLFPEGASSVGGVMDAPPQAPPTNSYETPPSPYPRDPAAEGGGHYYDKWGLPKVILWCVVALAFHFFLGGWGFIIAGFTIFDGVRMLRAKHPHALIAIGLASVTTLILVVRLAMGFA